MAANIKPPKAGYVTARHEVDFFTPNGSKAVFSVNEGVSLDDAFGQLGILLSAAQEVAEALASAAENSNECGAYWAPVHLLTFADALVQSMHTGYAEGQK